MGRHIIYTIEHVNQVKKLMKQKHTRRAAIKKAGFTDPSLFYKTLKRLGLEQTIDFTPVEKPSFL